MRIFYLHRTRAEGVEGVHIREIVNAWRNSGHTVQMIAPIDEIAPASASPLKPRATGTGFRRRVFAMMSKSVPELLFEVAEILYNFLTCRKLFACRHPRPDLMFERYAIFAVAGAWLSKVWSVPFILEVNYTSRSELVRQRSNLLKPLAFRADQFMFRRAFALIAVSTRLKEHLVAEYQILPERILVLPNAADPSVFDPQIVRPVLTLSKIPGRFIGFVGGFYPWHGVRLLIDAFCLIAEKFPDAKLLLVGDGPLRAQIADDCMRLNISDRVVMTGAVSHDLLPEYVSRFHVGVMPDSNDYGSPMKIFEYLSMAKPVVVPDYGPLRDVIVDGEQGFVVPPRDPMALASRLSMLFENPKIYARMSENARNLIVCRHNWMENSRRILALLPGEKQ